VALLGVALYVQGELHPGPAEPPLEPGGFRKHGHESCRFIPGCVSTYLADHKWVGAVFCLAPNENDWEVQDDIYSIQAYHQILQEWSRKPLERGSYGIRQIKLEVNLVLSTNYLANIRQVCSGSIRINLTAQGLSVAHERLLHVQETRLESQAALHPKRERKLLSEVVQGLQAREAAEERPALQPQGSAWGPPRLGQAEPPGPARPSGAPPPPQGPRLDPFGGGGSVQR